MASNVLPFFWHLASSSKDTRLTASADLVSSLESFQQAFLASRSTDGAKVEDEDEESDEESDAESGEEVDASGDEDEEQDEESQKLDKTLVKENADDVVYTVKRLVRGLASSRESSRLGFAVALTELMSRIDTISASQVLSLLLRASPQGSSMKGADARDVLFARLFGLTAIIQSKKLSAPSSSLSTFEKVVGQLRQLGEIKAWLRESAWWAIIEATRDLLASKVSWKEEGVQSLVEAVYGDKSWSQEKVALTLLLEDQRPKLSWKSLLSPTFKHIPLLHSSNLVVLGRLLKESDLEDEEEGISVAGSTGSWKPQLHFVWNTVFDTYFPSGKPVGAPGRAPFQDFFRVVVDESLFANSSSSERKYWGFSVLSRALTLVPGSQLPLLFTPNVMRCWINNLASSDRYLFKAAQNLAKQVQETVKANPTVGFTLLSVLVGKGGRPDFDKVTKTKTVETIMGSLTEDGAEDYVKYLQSIILGGEEKNSDLANLDDRRQWALDQLAGIFRNGSVPKTDAMVQSVLELLLVHAFFVVRKTDKKSPIVALRSAPKPALSEVTAAACRAKFFTCLVEITTAGPLTKEGKASAPQGCDASGKLWLLRIVDVLASLEKNKNVELMLDADDEIKKQRADALNTLSSLDKVKAKEGQQDIKRGVEILLSFSLLQTYDESDDALELLEEVDSAAQRMFNLTSGKASSSAADQPLPIDQLLDVLVALLDKGSADLRNLANQVVGMVASAFTPSSIEHLVAQLEQLTPDVLDQGDGVDEEGGEEEEEEQGEEEEDSVEEEEDSDLEVDDDEDESNLQVDPEFRKRVAEALQISGMGIEENNGDDDDEESEDDEVWDDEQMLKVDEQLAQVFRQRANASGKSTDMKNVHIQAIHFKNRILDFFDVFARKQSTSPVVLHIIVPLLRLVHSTALSEKDLSNKAAGILRSRLGKARDVPSTADEKQCAEILETIHTFARHASNADFSSLCSACSLFVVRSLDASAPKSTVVVDEYKKTLDDYMSRKNSSVHPAFIIDLVRRFPARAFPLALDLLAHGTSKEVKKVYRQVQAFSILTIFSQQLSTLAKTVPKPRLVSFVSESAKAVYGILEGAQQGGEAWNAQKLKDVARYALHLARTSKSVLGDDGAKVWDAPRLEQVSKDIKEGEKTKVMKGLHDLLNQLQIVLVGKKDKKEKKAKTSAKAAEAEEDAMDIDESVTTKAPAKKENKPNKSNEAKQKKRKSLDGKEKKSKKTKVASSSA